ncbi:peptidylprolyl isomerase [Tenacibaculum sp. 190524A05c]|uniref:peptidylprolyl isomerase n=1 Tax=Tenacibaculum platacis TaxID=3137852 RepID=UPI0032B1700A
MKFIRATLAIIFIISSSSCKKETEKEEKIAPKKVIEKKLDSVKPKVVKEVPKEKPWDSLNHKNVTAFLTEYGKQNKETKVVIKTKYGSIKLRLYNETPLHRASFVFLSKIGYFDKTVFHRIAGDMAIQGGESDGQESTDIKNKYKNYRIPAEMSDKRKHVYGSLALARQLDYNPYKKSNPFNFYIISTKRGAPHLDGDYTVFGEVISGFSTVRKISKVKTGRSDWPIVDIPMTITVLD